LHQSTFRNERKCWKQFKNKLLFQVANLRKSQVDQLVKLQNNIEALERQLSSFHSIADATDIKKVVSSGMHKSSAALLALEKALEGSSPVKNEVRRL